MLAVEAAIRKFPALDSPLQDFISKSEREAFLDGVQYTRDIIRDKYPDGPEKEMILEWLF